MSNKGLWLLLPLATLLALACSSNKPQPRTAPKPNGSPGGSGGLALKPTYVDDVKPLLDKYCVSCHAKGKSPRVDLSSYDAAKKAAASVASKVAGGSMPPSGALKKTEVDTFKAWSDTGAPEKATSLGGGGGIDGGRVTYDNWMKGFLKDNCVSCHKPGGTSPDLTTYAKAKAAAEKLLHQVEDGLMPPAPAKKIASAKVDKIRDWVSSDMPENDSAPTGGDDESGDGDAVDADGAAGDDDASGDDGSSGTTVTYAGEIKALLTARCTSCHTTGKTAPDLSTQAKAQAAASKALSEIQGGRMPPSGVISSTEKQQFKAWVDGGAK